MGTGRDGKGGRKRQIPTGQIRRPRYAFGLFHHQHACACALCKHGGALSVHLGLHSTHSMLANMHRVVPLHTRACKSSRLLPTPRTADPIRHSRARLLNEQRHAREPEGPRFLDEFLTPPLPRPGQKQPTACVPCQLSRDALQCGEQGRERVVPLD